MAKISFSDQVPNTYKDVHFSFGLVDFDLSQGGSFDTDDRDAIAGASQHPWLNVEFEEAPPEDTVRVDPNDPHQNPAADHLSIYASDEAKQQAQQNAAALQEAVQGQPPQTEAQEQDEAPAPRVTETNFLNNPDSGSND